MQEKIDINKIISAKVSLQAINPLTGEVKREVVGHNTITRRGLLEMILKYVTTQHYNDDPGYWALCSNSGNTRLPSSDLFNTIDKLPANCGSSIRNIRSRILLLTDNTPADTPDSTFSFSNLVYSHLISEKRNSGADIWNPSTCEMTLSWIYGATDWSGIVNSIIIGKTDTSPVNAAHRVLLPTPFEKLATENVVLNWTWTIALPEVV